MKHETFIICSGSIGGFLLTYGYLNKEIISAILGIVLITSMGAMALGKIALGAPRQTLAQKTEASDDVIYTNTINIPKPNIELRSGDCTMGIVLLFIEKKDVVHRLKWWMFCKVFPFEYEWIESEDKQ